MNRRATIGIVGVMVLACGCSGKLEWQSFTDPGNTFTVDLPGKPKTNTSTVGGNPATRYEVSVRNGSYMVSYIDFPPGTGYDYDNGIASIAAQYNGKVLTKKDVKLGGVSGKEFEATVTKPNTGHMFGRLFFVNTRLYMIVGVGSSARLNDADTQSFLDSFKLNK